MRFLGHNTADAGKNSEDSDDDGYANNKRSNGSNTQLEPFGSAIMFSRASRSEVRGPGVTDIRA